MLRTPENKKEIFSRVFVTLVVMVLLAGITHTAIVYAQLLKPGNSAPQYVAFFFLIPYAIVAAILSICGWIVNKRLQKAEAKKREEE